MLGNKGLIALVIFTTLTILTLGLDTSPEIKIFSMISITIGVVIIFYDIIKRMKTRQNSYTDDPLTILKKRYANGEITKEEFDKMKQDLG